MTPQTASFLLATDRAIADALTILTVNIANQAARLAYYAQFHAAQALIFERTAKVAKTHKGVATQFHKLAKAEPMLPPDFAGQLSAAYYFKAAADYDIGTAPPVTAVQAGDAIATAENFVSVISQLLEATPSPPGP